MAARSDSGRTVYPKIGVWYAEEDGHIRLSIEGQGLTSVTDDPASERYHRTLYQKLTEVLREAGAKSPPVAKGPAGA
jgi:hypothetical protein